MYQASDDDLPGKGREGSRFLFTAALHPPESEALVDADIELSVFRLSQGSDMQTSLVENFERERDNGYGILTPFIKEGVWTVGGVDFTYVDQESKTGIDRYRFFFRPLAEDLWLYGKIAGYERRAYEEALPIVEGMTFTAGRIG